MFISIAHYEPGSETPYDVEQFNHIEDFAYDHPTIRFTLEDGRDYRATFNHRITIVILDR